jgi:hypothetical protein
MSIVVDKLKTMGAPIGMVEQLVRVERTVTEDCLDLGAVSDGVLKKLVSSFQGRLTGTGGVVDALSAASREITNQIGVEDLVSVLDQNFRGPLGLLQIAPLSGRWLLPPAPDVSSNIEALASDVCREVLGNGKYLDSLLRLADAMSPSSDGASGLLADDDKIRPFLVSLAWRLVSERAMVASTVKWAAAEEDLKGDPLLEAFGEVTLHLPSGRFVVVPSEEPAQTWEDPTLKAVARMREKMARMRH